jgi:hypothetical protein
MAGFVASAIGPAYSFKRAETSGRQFPYEIGLVLPYNRRALLSALLPRSAFHPIQLKTNLLHRLHFFSAQGRS